MGQAGISAERRRKAGATMHSPDRNASPPMPSSQAVWRGRPVDDMVYQLVTLGAILLTLGSLWVF